MTVSQISALLNAVYSEYVGDSALVQEDLSNVVDVGTTIFQSTWKDNFVKSLIDQIGKMVFVDRPYSGFAPSILRSDWEYGSILAKVRAKDFEAVDNPSWQLTAGQTVDQFEYNPPTVKQTFWNHKESWQIECSFAEKQVKSAFDSAQQLNRFFSMIESTINNSRTLYMDALVMRTINGFMAEKIHATNGVINVLSAYNTDYGTSLTAAKAHTDKQFLRYLAYMMLDLRDRLSVKNSIYNLGGTGYTRDTPGDMLHVVLNSAYSRAIDVMMTADTYHDDMVSIGSYETVPYWQGSGTAYALTDRTSINVKLPSDNTETVTQQYIIGVMFDRDAMAINNTDMRVTSSYNANGEYYNNFYKVDTSNMIDTAENGIILTLA